jgi:hypothetical protein
MKHSLIKLVYVAAIAAMFPACASVDALNSKADTFLSNPTTQAVIADVTPIAESYLLSGGKIGSADAVNLGLQSIVKVATDPNVVKSNGDLWNLIANTASVFSGDPKFTKPGQDLATAVLKSLPTKPTPAQVQTAISAAGVAVSNAAN